MLRGLDSNNTVSGHIRYTTRSHISRQIVQAFAFYNFHTDASIEVPNSEIVRSGYIAVLRLKIYASSKSSVEFDLQLRHLLPDRAHFIFQC